MNTYTPRQRDVCQTVNTYNALLKYTHSLHVCFFIEFKRAVMILKMKNILGTRQTRINNARIFPRRAYSQDGHVGEPGRTRITSQNQVVNLFSFQVSDFHRLWQVVEVLACCKLAERDISYYDALELGASHSTNL